jgi:hypothetical protein
VQAGQLVGGELVQQRGVGLDVGGEQLAHDLLTDRGGGDHPAATVPGVRHPVGHAGPDQPVDDAGGGGRADHEQVAQPVRGGAALDHQDGQAAQLLDGERGRQQRGQLPAQSVLADLRAQLQDGGHLRRHRAGGLRAGAVRRVRGHGASSREQRGSSTSLCRANYLHADRPDP